jgi:putative phage-type endonuclease
MSLTPEQKEIRSRGVGASESPAILGIDPYRSAIDVWEKKLGISVDNEGHHTERGVFLEPGLREWAKKRTGLPFELCPTRTHPEHERVLASPDGVALDDNKRVRSVLEIKSPGPRTEDQWGPDGTDQTPDRYVIQLAQQMAVTGAKDGYIAALVDGDLRIYRFARDAGLEAEIIRSIEYFWAAYVETKAPPPVDGSGSASEWLGRKFPESRGPMIAASPSDAEIIQQLAALQEKVKHDEARLEFLKQCLKSTIGEGAGIECPGVGRVTWKSVKGRTDVDWAALAKHLGATNAHESQFLKTTKGHRVFRFWPAKETA